MTKIIGALITLISINTLATEKIVRAPAAIVGTSEIAIQGRYSWIKINGEPAEALYNALTIPAKNNQGEAGPEIFFKNGKSYRCIYNRVPNDYSCDFSITSPKNGKIN